MQQQQLYIKVFNVQRTGTGKHEFGVTTYDCYFLMPNVTKFILCHISLKDNTDNGDSWSIHCNVLLNE